MKEINYSIIIPHYNIPDLLERLLLSTPYDKKDVEVIVVDDRSDKGLERLFEIKHRFEVSGVKFYRNNNGKKGAGTCRNIGMRHATGKWLIFADSDDYFVEDFYEILTKYRDEECDVIYFKGDSVNVTTGQPGHRHEPYNNAVKAYLKDKSRKNELQLRFGIISPCYKLIRHSMITNNSIRFDQTPVANDVSFSTETGIYAGRIEGVDRVIYIVTEREGSLTKSFNKEIYKIRNRVFIKRCRLLKQCLSKEDWKVLNLSGHNRLIAMMEEGYPIYSVIDTAVRFAVNGIRPVDLSQINIRTMLHTMKSLINGRKAYL